MFRYRRQISPSLPAALVGAWIAVIAAAAPACANVITDWDEKAAGRRPEGIAAIAG